MILNPTFLPEAQRVAAWWLQGRQPAEIDLHLTFEQLSW